jgi:hypothetical protein
VATDIIERSVLAIVAVLEARTDIQAITGRPAGNVTAWNADIAAVLPIIAYRYVIATPGGGAIGDTREIVFVFSAVAATESTANALLEIVESILWAPALAALAQPLNGYMRNPVRRSIPWDETEDVSRSDLELTLTVTK